jgi:repressor of nif and glnA expression
VTNAHSNEIDGITLSVYLYVANKGKPVGPRDVMKGANLSSPSVSYRHLEKLEEMGLLEKNEYGMYVKKGKAHVRGYVWVGSRMMPKMLAYSLLFLCIFIVELVVFLLHYPVEDFKFAVFFALMLLITGSAMSVFFVEGLIQRKRTKLGLKKEKT